ncbi:nuclear transport factor 2 family protein [Phreatobacter sp. AB_2022a]|uniref:nuclear transport factor 2 family protein n=1 Tax=Phreatobacter sp. AB_2022a TaxID=3003134 RepID=UPI002287610A|nr:nuclear transport factor 2 family protein [Phreatobacter sp. AB_2022a]MCZ0733763.1 nuclear transport factor 2 family protein [Phreatobacter sp. AB_2022a]
MSYDRSTIEAVVQLYFDGLYECDADKLAEAFHPSADLRWNENGELKVLGYKDWLGLVRQRTSPKSQGHPRHDFLVTVDRSDEKTAFVKVKCALPPRFFIDYLVLMKLSDGWRVVSKSYRYETRE